MKENINFAVVGCGHIGKRHATIVNQLPECNLVALCDIKSKIDLAIEDFQNPFFDSIESLLAADLEIDVVCICTPNYLHAQHSLLAIQHGKHVVCEKPMGLSKRACEQVIHAALNQNRQVFCVMQNRYSPPSQWIKELVEKQVLGDIYLVHVDCFWNRDQRYYQPEGLAHAWKGIKEKDGGTLFTQFSHFIDMLYWLFGDFQNINARFFDFNHKNLTAFEDSGSIHFDFVNGGSGSINYSTSVWNQNFESSLTIIGEKGTIKIGGQYMNKVEYCHVENYQMPDLPAAGPPNDYGNYKGSAANHHFVIQNVIDVLKGTKNVTTNALEGLKVVEIIERIYNSQTKA